MTSGIPGVVEELPCRKTLLLFFLCGATLSCSCVALKVPLRYGQTPEAATAWLAAPNCINVIGVLPRKDRTSSTSKQLMIFCFGS